MRMTRNAAGFVLVAVLCGAAGPFAEGQPQRTTPKPAPKPAFDAANASDVVDIANLVFYLEGWSTWNKSLRNAINSKAREELNGKPDGSTVVIHAGSSDRVDTSRVPGDPIVTSRAPGAGTQVLTTVGKGSNSDQAISQAFMEPSIRQDTQTHQVVLATKKGESINVRRVEQQDINRVALQHTATLKAKAQADAARAQAEATKATEQARKATALAAAATEQKQKAAAQAEAERAAREKQAADKKRTQAEADAAAAAQRESQLQRSVQAAERCRGACLSERRRAGEAFEEASKWARTAMCASPELDGPVRAGCDGTTSCINCSTIASADRQQGLALSQTVDDELTRALLGASQGLRHRPGLRPAGRPGQLKLPDAPASGAYSIPMSVQ